MKKTKKIKPKTYEVLQTDINFNFFIKDIKSMKNADIVKIKEHFQDEMGKKTIIITTKTSVKYVGKNTELQKYVMYSLERSIGPRNMKNDELFHKIKEKIIETAKVSCEQALVALNSFLKENYPYNNINIWVWQAKQMEHSGWNNATAWASFRCTDDAAYGHDILIIIK